MPEIDLDDLSTPEHGYTVDDEDDDDPVLLDRSGNHVQTWRERYPYDHRMPRDEYERLKRRLQVELLKLQKHSKRTGARHVIVFEGRDAAGKGGTIQRTPDEYAEFIEQEPLFERMLFDNGINLTRLWFSVSPAERRTRFAIRLVDPVRQWKFSPTDMESINTWDDYTEAKEAMFEATDTDVAPWSVVRSNDKTHARINTMRFVLAKSDYDDKVDELVGEPDPLIVGRALTD